MSLFTCDYAVVIDRPFDEVYKYLTSSDHARAVVAASDLFAWFKEGERIGPDKLTFTMAERVPVLCGLFYSELTVEAEQEVDTERKMLHYNSRVRFRKLMAVAPVWRRVVPAALPIAPSPYHFMTGKQRHGADPQGAALRGSGRGQDEGGGAY